jgi:serine/threonine-protein kinase
MPGTSLERAAALAVLRFAADAARVDGILQEVCAAEGRAGDLVDQLVLAQLLTPQQARALLAELAGPPEAERPPINPKQTPVPPALLDNRPVLAPGRPLRRLGDFTILRRLGEGGMGAVYLGYHAGQQCQVAIKVLSEELAASRASVDRFYREARTGTLLRHPAIVRTITAAQDAETGRHYLVQEYVDGVSSHALLEKLGRLPVGDVVRIGLDVASALAYLHGRNFVHRDIKPDNILLTRTGQAKLADLGLAKRLGEVQPLTALHEGFGTPYYMPHEQALNARRVDGRSDIFALGATLYHLVTGEVPFPGEDAEEIFERKRVGAFRPASAINPAVPPGLDAILARMLAHDPGERPESGLQVVADLEQSQLAAAVPSFVSLDLVGMAVAEGNGLAASSQPTQPRLDPPHLPEPALTLLPDPRSNCPASLLSLGLSVGLGLLAVASAFLGRFILGL